MANGIPGPGISLRDYFAVQFKAIMDKLDSIERSNKERDDRLRDVEVREGANVAQWTAHKEEHVRQLGRQVGINSLIAAVLASISAWWSTR